jgi:hypothetical protein
MGAIAIAGLEAIGLVLGAALLIFDAIGTPRHRYVNLAEVAIMVGGVAFDRFRGSAAPDAVVTSRSCGCSLLCVG